MKKQKTKSITKTPERRAFDAMDTIDKLEVIKMFKAKTGYGKTAFYDKLRGVGRIRPMEKTILRELLNLSATA